MAYYYLDGPNKQGPYSADEIKSKNLSLETLVYADGTDYWKPLNSFPELTFEPNKDTIEGATQSSQHNEKESGGNKNELPLSGKGPKRAKIEIPLFLVFIIFVVFFTAIAYGVVSYWRQKDLASLNNNIDVLFGGKTSISDYRKHGNNGVLYNVTKGPLFQGVGDDDATVRIKNLILAIKPVSKNDAEDLQYKNQLQVWNEYKDLVQYYECEPNGGFTTLRLSKQGSNFDLEECWSGDMAYKVPESIYHPGRDFGYGVTSDAYNSPTFRPQIGTCYEAAAKYLTVDNEDKAYEAGSYENIENFDKLSSTFFKIENFSMLSFHIGNDAYVGYGQGPSNKIIRNSQITGASSSDDAAVFTSQWIVWYRSINNTYQLTEESKVFKEYWTIYSVIGAVLALIIVLIIKYRKRVAFKID